MQKRLMKLNGDRVLEKTENRPVKIVNSERKLKEEKKRIQKHIDKLKLKINDINNSLNEIDEEDK